MTKPIPTHTSEFRGRWSCPGKIFLLGEYSVLHGEPAVVAATAPRFELAATEKSPQAPFPFPEGSPAGRLRQSSDNPSLSLAWKDPLEGAGGLGASTAQFLLLYRAYAQYRKRPDDWPSALLCYRQLHSDSPIPPSGADLVAQSLGGITLFPQAQSVFPPAITRQLLLFSATLQAQRKVKTHEHLQEYAAHPLSPDQIAALGRITRQGWQALTSDHLRGFADALNAAAQLFSEFQLEIPATRADREALGSLPGVLAVKGAGALQADAIVVLANTGDRRDLIARAQARGLTLLADGLTPQPGAFS